MTKTQKFEKAFMKVINDVGYQKSSCLSYQFEINTSVGPLNLSLHKGTQRGDIGWIAGRFPEECKKQAAQILNSTEFHEHTGKYNFVVSKKIPIEDSINSMKYYLRIAEPMKEEIERKTSVKINDEYVEIPYVINNNKVRVSINGKTYFAKINADNYAYINVRLNLQIFD